MKKFLKSFRLSLSKEIIYLVIICILVIYFLVMTFIHRHISFVGLIIMSIAFAYLINFIFYDRSAWAKKKMKVPMPIIIDDDVIDLDADPFIPYEWTVKKHEKCGFFKWDSKKVHFYLSKQQKNGTSVNGNRLRKKLECKSVFNVNLLDWLLAHQNLIPEEWKEDKQGRIRYIFFLGTIYNNLGGSLSVRYLYWNGVEWRWGSRWLAQDWDIQSPAALRVSS